MYADFLIFIAHLYLGPSLQVISLKFRPSALSSDLKLSFLGLFGGLALW